MKVEIDYALKPDNLSKSFIKQRIRTIRQIILDLQNKNLMPTTLTGKSGFDIGCWYGMSTYALSSLGLSVSCIERASSVVSHGRRMGLLQPSQMIVAEASQVLETIPPVDVISFFGVTQGIDLVSIQQSAIAKLNPGGIIVMTSMPEMLAQFQALTYRGGKLFRPKSNYFWDQIGYIY